MDIEVETRHASGNASSSGFKATAGMNNREIFG